MLGFNEGHPDKAEKKEEEAGLSIASITITRKVRFLGLFS
jgi:hypothetical protein